MDNLVGNVYEMRRVMFLIGMALSLQGFAQSENVMEAIVRLTDTADPENLDSYEVERLEYFFRRPLRLNRASMAEMESCGLLTPYQLVSVADYRLRHGDILSYAELAMIEGFGQEIADALRPFISLDAGDEKKSGRSFRCDLYTRAGYRYDDAGKYMYGVKCRMEAGKTSASLAFSKPYDRKGYSPEAYSGNVVWNHALGKVMLGDFNARFGQGLCIWNSTLIGSLVSPASFMRKPSGLSSSFSFTGSTALTGLAADATLGRWKVSAFLATPGIKKSGIGQMSLMPAVNVSSYGRYGVISMTHYAEFSDFIKDASAYRIPGMKSSVDASLCVRGINIFGEFTYDWVACGIGALCGVDLMPCDMFRLAALVEGTASQNLKAAFSGELKNGRMKNHSGNFSVMASVYPEGRYRDIEMGVEFKGQTDWTFQINECLGLRLKLTERFRNWGRTFKTGVRVDMKYASEHFSGILRADFQRCVGTGFLGYAEGGYIKESISLYMRMGIFVVDDWEDRIYVYERDAPGSFNVPAYYGRGVWTAVNLSWGYSDWGRLYLRASYVGYQLMSPEKRKPGRAELKIQSVFRF